MGEHELLLIKIQVRVRSSGWKTPTVVDELKLNYGVKIGVEPNYKLTVCFNGNYDRFSIMNGLNFKGKTFIRESLCHSAYVSPQLKPEH